MLLPLILNCNVQLRDPYIQLSHPSILVSNNCSIIDTDILYTQILIDYFDYVRLSLTKLLQLQVVVIDSVRSADNEYKIETRRLILSLPPIS